MNIPEGICIWVLHPVACIIKVLRTAVLRNNFLKMFIHIYLPIFEQLIVYFT
jgi:hypothetical protein